MLLYSIRRENFLRVFLLACSVIHSAWLLFVFKSTFLFLRSEIDTRWDNVIGLLIIPLHCAHKLNSLDILW